MKDFDEFVNEMHDSETIRELEDSISEESSETPVNDRILFFIRKHHEWANS